MARITDIKDLKFSVELRSVCVDGIQENGKLGAYRAVVDSSGSGRLLGIVGSGYKLINNEQALELGKRCCRELFGPDEADTIEIFNVDAPATASYCFIDLIHRNYIMNLWDSPTQPDEYIPYVRVVNSYNASKALRFDIGFCRKLCLNGVIFETETISFRFSHSRHITNDLDDAVTFALQDEKIRNLFDQFKAYANTLKNYQISKEQSFNLIYALFGIKDKSKIKFESPNESREEYRALENTVCKTLDEYGETLGENGYSLFNVITDLASNDMENRYFRRERHSKQKLAGNWMQSFQREIKAANFDFNHYLARLQRSNDKSDFRMSTLSRPMASRGMRR